MGRVNGSNLYRFDETSGHVFMNVSSDFVPFLQKRKSVSTCAFHGASHVIDIPQLRLTSADFYNLGTVWVIDAYHLPWGCGVSPSDFHPKGYSS